MALNEEQQALLADVIEMRGPELAEHLLATSSNPRQVADHLEAIVRDFEGDETMETDVRTLRSAIVALRRS